HDNGKLTFSVTITDYAGLSNMRSFLVTLVNVAPRLTAAFTSPTVSCGTGNAALNVQISDPGADSFTAQITWGDGSSQSLGTVGSSFTVTHTYAHAGSYTATVTVTDDDG